MGNYSIDKRAEKELGVFLDKYFYPRLREKYGYDWFKRIWTREEQIHGIDVVASIKGRECAIDEKASLRYMKSELRTFAFELSFMKNGEERTGWFLNNQMRTQCYAIMYPKSEKSIEDIGAEDFESVEVLTIPVKRMWEYLGALGITKEVLERRSCEIRNRGEIGKRSVGGYVEGIYMRLSDRLEEEPINLIIGKSRLADIASGRFVVTRDNLSKIKQ
jgi:hypothetical protein